ncbi:MAG TPA: flagellar protein FlaG [Negativicutes bacterium]|nr:flagellar protein FlaG [Negativicutes bacterium]
MDVGTVQNPGNTAAIPGQKAGTPVPQEVKVPIPVQNAPAPVQETKGKVGTDADADKEKKVVENAVESLNKFMDLMTADIRFTMHQKSNRLMVQLVSEKDQTVLREYPSSEFLDMIANIREFVGILTDKKA